MVRVRRLLSAYQAGMRRYEPEVGLVPQSLWFAKSQRAFVDLAVSVLRRVWGDRRRNRGLWYVNRFFLFNASSQCQITRDNIVPAAKVSGRPRNRRRVIACKTLLTDRDALIRLWGHGLCFGAGISIGIEGQPKRLSKCCKSSFGSVGLGGFEPHVVRLGWR